MADDEEAHERELMERLVESGEPLREAMREAGTNAYTHPYVAPSGSVHDQASTEFAQHFYNKYKPTEKMMAKYEAAKDEIERDDPCNVFDPTGARAFAERLQKLEAGSAEPTDNEDD